MYGFAVNEPARLLGSGTILREVIAAAELLASDWQIASEVFSVTSFSESAREAREARDRFRPRQLQHAGERQLGGRLHI